MAVKYLAGERIIGTAAERIAMSLEGAPPQTSWKELARYTLTSAATSIRVGTGTQTGSGGGTGSFTAKDNLMVLMYYPNLGSGNSASPNLTFNDDEGSSSNNYSNKRNFNGGYENAVGSEDFLQDLWNSGQADTFVYMFIKNHDGAEKLTLTHSATGGSVAGDTTSCEGGEHSGKWANNAQVVNLKMTTSALYASGSEIIVLGMDDDEADSGTNFWQELEYKTLGGTNGTMQTDVFTAKKYLMVDMFLRQVTNQSTITTCFNDDFEDSSQTNYSSNNHEDGAALDDRDNVQGIYAPEDNDDWNFFNLFIANRSGREKILYMHNNFSATGNNAPHRTEYYGKWQTTSGQITKIGIHKHDGSTMPIDGDSIIRVWGGE